LGACRAARSREGAPTLTSTAMAQRTAKRLMLIGWDAADWKVINPMLDAGLMPTLEKLINEGVMGNLATLDPPLSPMLWTSIATGKRPYQHGIHGFTEPDGSGQGIRPVYNTGRKVKAVWNMLQQSGFKPHVVGWWPSHPAEPIDGVMVSNFYQKARKPIDEPWPMTEGTVHPPEKAEHFAKLRVHPGEITAQHILPFVPNAGRVNQAEDKRLGAIAKILADASSIHSAATWIAEHEEWDFLAVYHDAIDHFCHGFMKFHPPQMPGVPDTLFETYKDVVISAYRYHDMMLERMLELAGPETTVMLISDHGFHPDHLRPKALPKEPAAPALEHSPYGIFVLRGPGVRQDERIYGASILDVTPTVLTLFGLPVGRDMDGNALVNCFEQPVDLQVIPSWEQVPGNDGTHPPDRKEDAYANQEALEQLIELGYVERPDEDKEKAVRKTINENEFYLARAYIDGRKFEEAIPILERLFREDPEQSRYGVRLARCYQSTGRIAQCREVVDRLREGKEKPTPGLHLLQGSLLLSENKPLKALEEFQAAEQLAPDMAKIHLQIGRGYVQLRRWEEAERAFTRELAIDPESAPAWHGKGLAQLRQGRNEEALESLLNAVGLIYHFPFAHYHLGEALAGLGEHERAAEAFEVCLRMAPGVNKARQWLEKLYTEHLGQPEKAAALGGQIVANTTAEIVVVSGLPRSGTSMMMQMLDRGGVPVFTDGVRGADESNPKGYYEHEAVKALMRHQQFLGQAEGKAVKVVSHLIRHLPARYRYKVVFMERELDEVLRSQHRMLMHEGKAKEDTIPLRLAEAFRQNLDQVRAWLPEQANFEVLYVRHADVIRDPAAQAERVSAFLGGRLDTAAMAAVVDPSLHRQKA
jgi:predicted AlkP superfamily phosphohydrolase/phosphomutase/tetratricopeptide (TPR) repeat protein